MRTIKYMLLGFLIMCLLISVIAVFVVFFTKLLLMGLTVFIIIIGSYIFGRICMDVADSRRNR